MFLVCLFCCFTPQVNSYGHGGTVSSPNHTFSWASLNKQLTSTSCTYFACNWQQPFLNEGRRMTVEIISWSISTKVWDWAGIEPATPRFAVRLASVARHVTDCAMRPGAYMFLCIVNSCVECGWKQCGSWSADFNRSQLTWIYTVFKRFIFLKKLCTPCAYKVEYCTVKPVYNGHSQNDQSFQDKLSVNGGQSIAILWPALSYYLSLRSLFCLFLSGCFTQVLLYSISVYISLY